jgi:hypothetical protein
LTRAKKAQNHLGTLWRYLNQPRLSLDEEGKGGGRFVLVKEHRVTRHALLTRGLDNHGERRGIKALKKRDGSEIITVGHRG